MEKIVEQIWDYTKHAKFYSYRPNYASLSIDMLVELAKRTSQDSKIKVVDMGAGAGNLSIMLAERDCEVVAVEPNDAIIEFVPNYTRGTTREDQRPVIEKRKDLFDNIIYTEEDFYFHQSIENYINAWRSVKNRY